MPTENLPTTPATPETPTTPAPDANSPTQTSSPSSLSADGTQTSSGTDLGAGDAPKKVEDTSGTDLGADPAPEGEDKSDEPKPNPYHGAPEGDAEYTDLVAPDGFEINPELQKEFTPIAKELNLSKQGVEKLIEFEAQLGKKRVEAWGSHLKELKTIAQADPEIGGAKYQPAVQAAIQARDKFGTPAFRKMLNDYGVGAHPEMIKFLSKVQSTMGEKPSLGNGDGPGNPPKALHDILYKDPT